MKQFKTVLGASVASIAMVVVATPAAAQSADTTTTAEPQAKPDVDDSGGNIVVTAQRREERVQDIPVAITAFGGDQLARSGVISIDTIAPRVPSFYFGSFGATRPQLYIRGIGTRSFDPGSESSVGVFEDEVYLGRSSGSFGSLKDVERIEVLRGPQGTLYGRNTIGGAIKYVTRPLGHDFAARLRASYGSYNQRDFVGSVTIPVGDTFAIGGAVAYYKRDGFGKNLTTGADQYNKDVLAGRLSAEWTPTDKINIRIAGDKTHDKSNPRHGYRLLPNGNLPNFLPLASVYDTRAGVGDRNRVDTEGVSGTAAFEASDALTLKSITAYRKGKTDTVIDFDGTPGPVLDIPSFYKDHQFTQELQAQVQMHRVQGVVGLYYLNGSASGAFDTVIGNANLTTLTSGTVKTKSYAAFADVSVDLTDQLAISAGGRYTHDKREGTVFRADYLGLRSPLFGRPSAVPFRIRTNYTNSRVDEKFTPRVSLRYKPIEDITLYGSYSQGFKSGGFDPRGDAIFTPGTVNGYKPETVTAYEAGMKGAFLDRSLFVNLAGFYSNYKDQQVTTQFVSGTTVVSSVDNVGKSRIYGMELEMRAVPSRDFSATASFGYINAKFKQFLTLDPVTLTIKDFAGQKRFQNTPTFTVNVAATWGHDFDGFGRIAITPSIAYRSDYTLFETPTPVLDQDGYAVLDASIVWTSPNDKLQISGHGRNLANTKYRVGGYNFPGALTGNSVIGFYGPPRTFTITAEVRF